MRSFSIVWGLFFKDYSAWGYLSTAPFHYMPRLLSTSQGQLQNLQEQVELTKAELGKPFPQEAELAQKSQRLAELNSILDMDGKKNNSERDSENRDDTDRPSVLDDLHRRVEEMPPHRRTESRGLEERA